MAFGGFSQGDTRPLQSDINMVPLIDVMLVLLIVFMITAPLLTHSVKIDLPQASSNPTQEKPETVSVSIDGEGRIFGTTRVSTRWRCLRAWPRPRRRHRSPNCTCARTATRATRSSPT